MDRGKRRADLFVQMPIGRVRQRACGEAVQAVVATIVSDADDYAATVLAALEKAGLRVESDIRNEKINLKVREHSLAKVPYMLVVGRREAEEGTVALRSLVGGEQVVLPLAEAVARIAGEAVPPDLKR